MSALRTIAQFLLILFSGIAYASDSTTLLSNQLTERLINALPGVWDGRAIETPVGPVEYAIHFHTCDKNVIAGVAELKVSDHHWRFWRSDDELRLTFLSTFRGNQTPTQLLISKIEDNTIWFHAPERALLTLSVTAVEPHVDIRVYHHHEPHVYIRLTRSDGHMPDGERTQNKVKSCRIL